MPQAKTTIYLEKSLHARLKAIALREERTLTAVIQQGLREYAYGARRRGRSRATLAKLRAQLRKGYFDGDGTPGADHHNDIYE